MRFLCALLTVYVFALSIHTCADGNTSGHEVSTLEQTSDGHGEMDLCSPFCTCTCCAGITHVKVNHFQHFIPMHTLVYSESTSTVLSMPRTPVWQPPQA